MYIICIYESASRFSRGTVLNSLKQSGINIKNKQTNKQKNPLKSEAIYETGLSGIYSALLQLVPRATLFDSASDRGRIGLWERQFAWQPRWPLGCANPCCRSVISRQLGRNGF